VSRPNITPDVYKEIAASIGTLVGEKNTAYGDSFGQASKILEVLYPEGIAPSQYRDALAITRLKRFVQKHIFKVIFLKRA